MKLFRFILALSALAVIPGCSYMADVTLFNNTGAEITANWESDNPITIMANGFSWFGDIAGYSKRKVHLSSGGCEYLYEASPELKDYGPDRKLDRRGLQIQVEKDFSVVLLIPSYAGNAPASGDMVLQHEGFPLHPVAKTCGAETAR